VKYSDLSVVIPAAGAGERLGLGPKASLELAGKPILTWLTDKLSRLSDEVIVAVPPGQLSQFETLCPTARCIEGGVTRQESVERLFAASSRPWILLSDAARPFITPGLCVAVLATARIHGAAAAALTPDVPVSRIREGFFSEVLIPRDTGIFQTPQVFSRTVLETTLARAKAEGWAEQSTLQLVLRAGFRAAAVPGEKTNIKLTTPEDWRFGQSLIDLLP